jgi:hypothetical protein
MDKTQTTFEIIVHQSFFGPEIYQTIAHCSNWRPTLPASTGLFLSLLFGGKKSRAKTTFEHGFIQFIRGLLPSWPLAPDVRPPARPGSDPRPN